MNNAFPTYAENTQLLFCIPEMVYDLYKQDWIDEHTTPQARLKSIHEYYAYIQECMEYGDTQPDSYEDYLFDYGFDGSLYVCYDEFLGAEYLDRSYVAHLLNNDPVLMAAYDADIDASNNENDGDDYADNEDDEDDDDFDNEIVTPNKTNIVSMIYDGESEETLRLACAPEYIKSQAISPTEGCRAVYYPKMCKKCFDKHKHIFGETRYHSIAAGYCMVDGCSNPAEYHVRFEIDELVIENEAK